MSNTGMTCYHVYLKPLYMSILVQNDTDIVIETSSWAKKAKGKGLQYVKDYVIEHGGDLYTVDRMGFFNSYAVTYIIKQGKLIKEDALEWKNL